MKERKNEKQRNNLSRNLMLVFVFIFLTSWGYAEGDVQTKLERIKAQEDKLAAMKKSLRIDRLSSSFDKGIAPIDAESLAAVKDEMFNISLGDGINGLKIKADIRLRYERRETQDGSRESTNDRVRQRVRIGLSFMSSDNWRFDIGLATGGNNGTSSDDTFGEEKDFETGDLRLDYASATYMMETMTVILGQQMNPFLTTGLLWDSDVRPVGITGKFHSGMLFFTLGLYDVVRNIDAYGDDSKSDNLLISAQIGLTGKMDGLTDKMEEVSYNLALGFHRYNQGVIDNIRNKLAVAVTDEDVANDVANAHQAYAERREALQSAEALVITADELERLRVANSEAEALASRLQTHASGVAAIMRRDETAIGTLRETAATTDAAALYTAYQEALAAYEADSGDSNLQNALTTARRDYNTALTADQAVIDALRDNQLLDLIDATSEAAGLLTTAQVTDADALKTTADMTDAAALYTAYQEALADFEEDPNSNQSALITARTAYEEALAADQAYAVALTADRAVVDIVGAAVAQKAYDDALAAGETEEAAQAAADQARALIERLLAEGKVVDMYIYPSVDHDMSLIDLYADISFDLGMTEFMAYAHLVKNIGAADSIGGGVFGGRLNLGSDLAIGGTGRNADTRYGLNPSANDMAFSIGIKGNHDRFMFGIAYSEIESDSVYGVLTDQDFGVITKLLSTDVKGYVLSLGYQLSEHLSINGKYFDVERLNPDVETALKNPYADNDEANLIQLDLNYKF